MGSRQRACVSLGCLAGVLLVGGGDRPRAATQGVGRLAAFEQHQALKRSSPFSKLTWQFLGPTNISGRVNAMAVADRGGRRRIYAGFSGSGLWATDDNAMTWQPVFVDAAATAINAVAVAPSNPSIVWILTGTNRSHIPLASAGVFKSTDAGRTWQHMGLADVGEGGFGQIVIHPRRPDTVYVAASGGPDAARNTRGLFKTIDGGRNWKPILDRGVNSGAWQLLMDPSDPETLYTTTHARSRGNELPLSLMDDERPSIFKTTDGGRTWSEIVSGLPEARFRAVGPNGGHAISIGISPSHPNVLYAVLDSQDPGVQTPQFSPPGLYRSDDRGGRWQRIERSGGQSLAAWIGGIRVDPKDDQTIVVFGVMLYVSHDGGHSFRVVNGPHSDHNAFWFDPIRAGLAYDGTDGGLYTHEGVGEAWTLTASAPTSQTYDVALDQATPFHVYTSVQDQFSYRGTVDIRASRDGVPSVSFERVPGAEVTSHAIDPEGRYLFAANSYGGTPIVRSELAPSAGAARMPIQPITPRPSATEPALHGAWFAPILMSPFDAKTVYVGYKQLYRSSNLGTTWEPISPDLTSGAPDERRTTDFSNLAVQTIAESTRQRVVIYAGTDDGRLHLTRDGGKTWKDLTNNLPHHVWIWQVVASAFDDASLYVLDRGRDDDDFAPYAYRSADYGATFASVVANLPGVAVNVIREDPANPKILYAGTDFGVYISTDAGVRWSVLGGNLPPVPVTDIQIHARDHMMVISTFGRGMWVLDALKIRPAPEQGR